MSLLFFPPGRHASSRHRTPSVVPRHNCNWQWQTAVDAPGRPGRVHPEGGRGCRRTSATEDGPGGVSRPDGPPAPGGSPRRRRSLVDASPPRSKVRMPSAAAPRVASRIAGAAAPDTAWPSTMDAWSRAAAQARSMAIGLATFLPWRRRRGAVGRLGHGHGRPQVVVEGQQHRLGAGDRAEQGQHQVGQAVAVAVEGRDHQRLVVGFGQQAGVGGIDQHRPVRDVGVTCRRRVHLLLEHPLIDRRHRPLGTAEHAGPEAVGRLERVLGHRPAHRPVDPLGPPRLLVRRPPAGPSRPSAAP